MTPAPNELQQARELEAEINTINYYAHCVAWDTTWSCIDTSSCPVCGMLVEPFASVVDTELVLHVEEDWEPEDGWPESSATLFDLLEEYRG